MKLLTKIRALFTHNEVPVDMPLAAAEIRGNRVYLHPAEDVRKTIRMRASSVDICINPESVVRDSDMLTLRTAPKQEGGEKDGLKKSANGAKQSQISKGEKTTAPYKEPMKTVSFRIYQEEYDSLMEIISSNGYRKAEYLLACVHAAKKTSMETTYQRYFDAHNKRKKAEREAAKRFRAEQAKNHRPEST